MATNTKPIFGTKLILLGAQGVGKTCLGIRFTENRFNALRAPESTIVAAFMSKVIELDSERVRFEIWDTAGQERFRTFAAMYYRNAAAAIVVYDITKPETYVQAQEWISEVNRQADVPVMFALCGNKADLDDQRQIRKEEAQKYADDNGYLFYEVSAADGTNVFALFEAIARQCPKNYNLIDPDSPRVSLVDDRSTDRKSCC